MMTAPLLVFDTNILMDLLIGRDSSVALLVKLAEERRVELIIPQYVLFEFRGTALRWIRGELDTLSRVNGYSNAWGRSHQLGEAAEQIKQATASLRETLTQMMGEVDAVIARISQVATVREHTLEVHFRGDLRYLAGHPPDRPRDGIKDCRIYEAVLEIARDVREQPRLKLLVTRDNDFDFADLRAELETLGVGLRHKPGALYGELLRGALA